MLNLHRFFFLNQFTIDNELAGDGCVKNKVSKGILDSVCIVSINDDIKFVDCFSSNFGGH
jgi:hypothetical protein